jgi:DNA-binding GntR family transcriptional regulator
MYRVRRPASVGNDQEVPRSPELPSARVEAGLRHRIDVGEWASGEVLPPVATLAAEYGVSRGTVARALRALANDGLVRVVPRWGTFRM